MLAETTIDLVATFLPDAKSMASFARASRHSKSTVYANIPAAIKSAEPKMTRYQRETLHYLKENAGIGHLKALVEHKCIVCKRGYRGGIRYPWGIPAHEECTKGLEANVRYVKGGVPSELMPLLRSVIPVNVRQGYSSHHGRYTYETVILRAVPGVIPREMTIEYFYQARADDVSEWLEKVRAEEHAKRVSRKRRADEQRIERQKKQKTRNEERRASIEALTGTSYLKWMRTVPNVAKKFVSKLSAEDSVAAASLVASNAHLPEETHQILLQVDWRYYSPSVAKIKNDYEFVRELGEKAIGLLRCHGCIAEVRAELRRREIDQQSRDARAMVREDKYTLKQPGDTSSTCRCGGTPAWECVFNLCGSCCPKVTCERHYSRFDFM